MVLYEAKTRRWQLSRLVVLQPGNSCGTIWLDFIHLNSHINFTGLTKTEAA